MSLANKKQSRKDREVLDLKRVLITNMAQDINGIPSPKKPMRKSLKFLLISVISLILIITVAGIASTIHDNNVRNEAIAASKAHLAADPLSVNGVYTALNKERITTGAPALVSLQNLNNAATQYCSDMAGGNYFDYKNPSTSKEGNSFITDNQGDLYFKNYVASISKVNQLAQTATEAVSALVASQAANVNNPIYNSVGWALCQPPTDPVQQYLVGMLVDKEDKPVTRAAPATVNNNYYSTPSYTPYVAPRITNCTSYYIGTFLHTYCY